MLINVTIKQSLHFAIIYKTAQQNATVLLDSHACSVNVISSRILALLRTPKKKSV